MGTITMFKCEVHGTKLLRSACGDRWEAYNGTGKSIVGKPNGLSSQDKRCVGCEVGKAHHAGDRPETWPNGRPIELVDQIVPAATLTRPRTAPVALPPPQPPLPPPPAPDAPVTGQEWGAGEDEEARAYLEKEDPIVPSAEGWGGAEPEYRADSFGDDEDTEHVGDDNPEPEPELAFDPKTGALTLAPVEVDVPVTRKVQRKPEYGGPALAARGNTVPATPDAMNAQALARVNRIDFGDQLVHIGDDRIGSVKEWADKLGLTVYGIKARVARGMPLVEACTYPKQAHGRPVRERAPIPKPYGVDDANREISAGLERAKTDPAFAARFEDELREDLKHAEPSLLATMGVKPMKPIRSVARDVVQEARELLEAGARLHTALVEERAKLTARIVEIDAAIAALPRAVGG